MAANGTDVASQLSEQWIGHIVPRSFNAGFVALSFVVSLIGSTSTLELLNRRTAPKGSFNHLLLLSAAVTMGGVSIWSMHFVGQRSVVIADGQLELQIVYSGGFTALSFFVPIVVLLAAFVAIGSNNEISWGRVAIGGAIAGGAINGMHFIGDYSISNYNCVYNVVNVVGSVVIAIAASITALSIFFVFRAAWTNSWWKQAMSAVLLAGAVSGMHFCASAGTQYRLVAVNTGDNQLSRNTTVIVVICLSVGACLLMAGIAVYTASVMKRYASKAQQVVVAAALFDRQGRVLVSPDGLLPSEKITATFAEKSAQDSFTEAHYLFHWMFRASRNWTSLVSLVPGITSHLSQLSQDSRNDIKLTNDHGEVIENYDMVFKELFCAAAMALANKLKIGLESVGSLWDEILPTGAEPRQRRRREEERGADNDAGRRKSGTHDGSSAHGDEDLAEKGAFGQRLHEVGRGTLMFLVRRVESSHDIEALEAAGYRFAEVHQVSSIIRSRMQIKTRDIESRLLKMAEYGLEDTLIEPGVHLGFFGARARVGAQGFDVLVRSEARNLLPSVQLDLDRLEPWHIDFLRQFDRMSPSAVSRALKGMQKLAPQEQAFASTLSSSLIAMRAWMDHIIFEESILSTSPVDVPCRDSAAPASMIAFRAVIPIHLQPVSSSCELIPLNFFKVQQLVYKDSPYHLSFSRTAHRELSPVIKSRQAGSPQQGPGLSGRLRRLRRPGTASAGVAIDADGRPMLAKMPRSSSPANSTRTSSTVKLNNNTSASSADPEFGQGWEGTAPASSRVQQPSAYGGIMVSQEITVRVQNSNTPAAGAPGGHRQTGSQGIAPAGAGLGEAGQGSVGFTSTATASARNSRADGLGTGIEMSRLNVEADGMNEAATFVDELFAICVNSR